MENKKQSYEFKSESKFIGESKLMTVDTVLGVPFGDENSSETTITIKSTPTNLDFLKKSDSYLTNIETGEIKTAWPGSLQNPELFYSDLVSFGQYLLSEERRSMIQGDPNVVYHADLENWKEKQKNK